MSEQVSNPEEHQRILRYLRKQMTADELAEFEIHLMNDPELIRATQREEAMIAALHECQHALVSKSAHSSRLGFKEWFFQPMTAAAAVVVLLVSVPLISLQERVAGNSSIESLQIASSHYVEGLRSASQALRIEAKFPLLLNIDIGPGGTDRLFSLRMREVDGDRLVYQADEQRVSEEGYLSLLLREPVSGDFQIIALEEGFQKPGAEAESISYIISLQ